MLPVLIHFRDVGIALFQIKPPSVMPHHAGGEEKHGETLAAALRVPDHAGATVPAFPPRIRPAQ